MNGDDPEVTQDEPSRPSRDDQLGETQSLRGEKTSPGGAADANPEQWIGRRLGKYEITELLGVGGMGVVLKAHDTSIERDVAIKVLPPEFSSDERSLARFVSEAKSAGKLNHQHTVMIHEISEEDDTHFLVMEFVPGGSLGDQLESTGACSVQKATEQIIQACDGLAAAHQAGLIHRDVKPANLLLSQGGTVKVSDFGLAKRLDSQSMQVTQAGQLVGTPYFMSPEQCESKTLDERSDVYSLGATYYSLLTGKYPFEDSDSVVKVMFAHCNAAPPDPLEINASVPSACARIIERAMAKRPEDRYQSMMEMRADLQAVLAAMSGDGIALPSRTLSEISKQPIDRRLWIGGAIAITVLAVVAGFFALRGSNEADPARDALAADTESSKPVFIAPTGEPIKVGVLHSMSGTMATSETPVVDATMMAIEEINQAGGLLGRPVEAIVADGKSDSATFEREATRLIDSEGVCVVFGCWTSASRKTVVPVFEQTDHLLVYPLQYEGIEESPNVIYTGASPNQQIIPAVKWAFAFENKRRFFIVGSDYVFPRVAGEIIKDQLAELGAELVGEEFLALGSTDTAAVVGKISESGADVILNLINGDTNTAFFKELRSAGVTPAKTPTISFSIGEAELAQLDSSSMTGDYAAWNYFQSIDTPENQTFVQSIQKRYGADRVVTDPMEAAYFGVKLWAQAIAAAQTTETAVIRREMRNHRMIAPQGEVRIDPATQHTFKTPRIGRVKADGQFEVVWTAVKPEPPAPYPPSRTTETWKALLHDLYTLWGNQWSAPSN